jgi:hypothetical protein
VQDQPDGTKADEHAEQRPRRQQSPQRTPTQPATTTTPPRPHRHRVMPGVGAVAGVRTMMPANGMRESTQCHDAQTGGAESECEFVDVHR